MMTTREQVVQEAISWLGTPYHHMGRVKGVGVDCGQYLVAVFHNAGAIPNIDLGQYPNDWHFHRSDEQYLKWINQYAHEVTTPKYGDIILFKFGRCISHGAIYLGEDKLIHSYLMVGVVYNKLSDANLQNRVHGYYSIWDN